MLNQQRTIIDILKSKSRTLSAEIIPPRNGSETESILRQIATLNQVPVDFISVTKGAGGSLRGGTLPIAQLIKSQFNICSLAHFTCRDYTVEEIENNLMDHHYFGITNILALRGDPPDGKPDIFAPTKNRHSYAWQVVEQIKQLNQGQYLVREGFDTSTAQKTRQATPTQFCIGVAAYPEDQPIEQAVEYLKIKVNKGADFAITQMLFNADIYADFLNRCAKNNISIPILPGLRILTQATTAKRMQSKFKVAVPNQLITKLEQCSTKEDAKKVGIEFTYQLSQNLLKAGAPGIHLFIMNDEKSAYELFKSLQ